MYKALIAVFLLPVIGMLLLAGVIVESAQAHPAPGAAAAAGSAPLRSDFSLAPARTASSPAMGGPYEPVPAEASEPDPGRWRIASDPRAERRFAPPAPPSLNRITLRF